MAADHSSSQAIADPHGGAQAAHEHPTWSTYWKVAVILGVLTALEVYVYYTPLQQSRMFGPVLIALSITKFVIVVMFYMHLKYDSKLFRMLFVGPLAIALIAVFSLLFLFGQLVIHLR
ncbi:MAG TPA: cytochrome C oxidase subunit IV family protein [Gemmatimonadaceae bacterium]|nr:cytochrome C oxidase subunit IV family protein [Gemmatimonadaceae bacterium]